LDKKKAKTLDFYWYFGLYWTVLDNGLAEAVGFDKTTINNQCP